MRHKAIAQDLSWLKPARKWEAVLEGLLTGSSEAKDRGAAVRTPVQTPENVARSEKTAALREEAKVCLKQYCAHQSVCYVNYVSQEGQQQPCCTIDKDDAVSKRTGRAAL
jgi:hypothetical protein